MTDPLLNLSPLDGRYQEKVQELSEYFSEAALIRFRVLVEVEWFIFLCNQLKLKGTRVFKPGELKEIRSIYEYFDQINAKRVKELEKTTNHDVKAVEYFLKENLKGSAFEPYFEFIHFACTSEDVNNSAYGLMLRESLQKVMMPVLSGLLELITKQAQQYKSTVMISRTHGQPATPTTMGKEFINIAARLQRQLKNLQSLTILGKINGAVGNFNAHVIAYPEIDWIKASQQFIKNLGLEPNLYTTQIEPHDYLAEMFDIFKRINTIIIDFNRDLWLYISFGYFKQKTKKGEVGSSTMPHKINPIDFENSEGNLGLANALFEYFSGKLPLSRLQRDLTDSTTLRNIGCAFGYSLLAYKNCLQGLHKLEINPERLKADLENAWELLAEPIQTVMRKYKLKQAYERLKDLTRGKTITKQMLHTFIDKLEIPASKKKQLKSLTPAKYSGLAAKLVENFLATKI